MDRESNRPRGRSGRDAQHLRDIAHHYLSGSRKPAAPTQRAARRFCLGVTSPVDNLAKVDLCANMALQFARLGRRTLAIDLDAALPNVGFRMGLSPAFYLRHLQEDSSLSVERGPLGVRLLVGVGLSKADLPEQVRQEVQQADCLVVNLPASVDSLHAWQDLLDACRSTAAGASLPSVDGNENPQPTAHVEESAATERGARRSSAPLANPRSYRTTMARAGAQSRMFGQWLETAQRRDAQSQEVESGDGPAFDALIFVQKGPSQRSRLEDLQAWQEAVTAARVHLVQSRASDMGAVSASPMGSASVSQEPLPWATLQSAPKSVALRHPSSLLYPEHASSRLFESLAQSLLASGRSRGGGDVRAS